MPNSNAMIYNPGSKSKVTVVRLVSRQKWHQLAEILRRADLARDLPVPFDDRPPADRLPEAHVVHLACQSQAPCAIVEMLVARYPDGPSTVARGGRYPLHIACARGLKARTVDFLLRAHPAAAGARDDYGKTPLHYACESYACHFGTVPGHAGRSPTRSLLDVVSMLLVEAPLVPNVEDMCGRNAIEYALENDVDLSIIKKMQHSSRDNWRTMRKSHRGVSHDKLRQSVNSLTSSFTSLTSSMNSLTMSSEDINRTHREGEAKGTPLPPMRIDRTEAKMHYARSA